MNFKVFEIPEGVIQRCRLFVDMDGTLVVWKHARNVEQLLEEGYFRTMPPYKSVVQATKLLIDAGLPVYSLSAYMTESQYALDEKNGWLDEYIPEINSAHRVFCPCAESKWQHAREMSDDNAINVLLDDYSLNLHDWAENGGVGIKLMNGVNGTKGSWQGHKVSRFCPAEHLAKEILNLITDELRISAA